MSIQSRGQQISDGPWILTLLLLYILGCAQRGPVDFSDICLRIKEGADSHFSKDAFGIPYVGSKPWHVYTTFTSNRALRNLIIHSLKNRDSSSCNESRGGSFKLREEASRGVTAILTIDSSFKAENDYYLVRALFPMYDAGKDEFVTCFWLKDHSWTSGLQIVVRYKIESDRGVLVSADYLVVADVEEDN